MTVLGRKKGGEGGNDEQGMDGKERDDNESRSGSPSEKSGTPSKKDASSATNSSRSTMRSEDKSSPTGTQTSTAPACRLRPRAVADEWCNPANGHAHTTTTTKTETTLTTLQLPVEVRGASLLPL
jgi:hypothetical protein